MMIVIKLLMLVGAYFLLVSMFNMLQTLFFPTKECTLRLISDKYTITNKEYHTLEAQLKSMYDHGDTISQGMCLKLSEYKTAVIYKLEHFNNTTVVYIKGEYYEPV